MRFSNGRLDIARELQLRHIGQPSTPRTIAVHYTVTDTISSARNALYSAGLSYHFLIEPAYELIKPFP